MTFTIITLLTACRAETPAVTVENIAAASAWGAVHTFGYAEQGDAPALIVRGDDVIGVWVSADDRDTYHTLRRVNVATGERGETNRLPILTAFPRFYRVAPVRGGDYHLLWLDAQPDDPFAGVRVWSLNIDSTPDATRGARITNETPVYHLDVLPAPDGGLWAFFSADPIAEPTLYAQFIDSAGRHRPAERIAYNADRPAALRLDNGVTRLFWQTMPGAMLVSTAFDPSPDGGLLESPQTHVAAPTLHEGDWLEHIQIAADVTHVYVFWNITRAEGDFAETWFATATHTLDDWTPPRRLTVGDDGRGMAWASPAQSDGLPAMLYVAGQVGGELGVVRLDGGAHAGYEAVITLAHPGLIGLPALHHALDGRLTLAWAQPTAVGAAMNLTTKADQSRGR